MYNTKKSQIFTTDFFVAFFIFSILLIVTMAYWNNYNSKIDRSVESSAIITKAFQISNVLVKNNGYPEDWNADNVKVIGLAESDRVLSSEKVNLFAGMPLKESKEILQTHNLNFSFTLKDSDENILLRCGDNMSNPKISVSARRYVIYNNEETIVEFNLWKEK